MQWVLQDLMFLREAGISIDRETFDSVLAYENCNWGLYDCALCGTPSMGQHANFCKLASILWESDWYQRVQEVEDRPKKLVTMDEFFDMVIEAIKKMTPGEVRVLRKRLDEMKLSP